MSSASEEGGEARACELEESWTDLKIALPVLDEMAEDMYQSEQSAMNLNWLRKFAELDPKEDSSHVDSPNGLDELPGDDGRCPFGNDPFLGDGFR